MKTVFRLHDGDTVQDCSPSGLEEKAEASLEGVQNAKGSIRSSLVWGDGFGCPIFFPLHGSYPGQEHRK